MFQFENKCLNLKTNVSFQNKCFTFFIFEKNKNIETGQNFTGSK